MPEDMLKNFQNTIETVNDVNENGIREYALTYDILQNDNLYFVQSRYNTNFYLTFYDKNTKKTVTTSDKFINGEKMANLFLLSDTVWYGYVDASDIDSYIVMEYLTEESKQKLSQIKEDDNPVIVKYYLK
ncbi:hypothetical protein FACS189432_08910 [Bacteroidia bacterium]|nr:hypothetical protein FACS189432_08910 [Bacteroidia bacterium]